MSDVPTASTSTASTSSASTSQIMPYTFDNSCSMRDLDYTTTDESEISSDEESEMIDDNSSYPSDVLNKFQSFIGDNMDDTSWSSSTSSNTSCENNSSAESSETECIIKEMIKQKWSLDKSTTTNQENPESLISPILILVQQPCETEGQMNEIGIDLINVEEHAKRLKELEKEIDFIESTEWMYHPIDSSIR